MSEHPNAALVRQGFERFVQGDVAGLARALRRRRGLARSRRERDGGDYRGRDEIIAFLRRTAELTGGTYRVELLWVVADDEHTVAVYRAHGERDGGRALDIEQALLIELRDGLWTDIRAQPLDQPAFDAFWPSTDVLGSLRPHQRRPRTAVLQLVLLEQPRLDLRRRRRRASQTRMPSRTNGPATTRT